MTPEQLQQWVALFTSAEQIGQVVFEGVKALAGANLSADELKDLEAAWQADVVRAAANAGITPAPDQP